MEISAMTDEARILEALKQVNDPDVGVNIVDLGLVQAVRPTTGRVEVDIIMTTPACPQSAFLQDEIERKVAQLGATAKVTVLQAPLWDPSRMSDAARAQLGWPGR
jgi:metal-sulfur cluster biosynthetic enzyme